MDGPAAAPDGSPLTLAVIGLSGPQLRAAEVVRPAGAGPRLRRLGAVTFDFDAERAVFGTGDADALADVEAALADVLGGTEAAALVVVAHPPVATTFFTPLPADLPDDARESQLRQETALLADLAPTEPVRVRAVPVRAEPSEEGGRVWFQVLHVAEPVHGRIERLAGALGVADYEVVDATRAAAAALLATTEAGDGVDVVVGAYETHTEVALCQGGTFLFSHYGLGTTPADTAYFALGALQQAGVGTADAGRLVVYGDAATAERLALAGEFLDRDRQPLDPFQAFGRRVEMPDAERAAFAPVLGAAL